MQFSVQGKPLLNWNENWLHEEVGNLRIRVALNYFSAVDWIPSDCITVVENRSRAKFLKSNKTILPFHEKKILQSPSKNLIFMSGPFCRVGVTMLQWYTLAQWSCAYKQHVVLMLLIIRDVHFRPRSSSKTVIHSRLRHECSFCLQLLKQLHLLPGLSGVAVKGKLVILGKDVVAWNSRMQCNVHISPNVFFWKAELEIILMATNQSKYWWRRKINN